jgi:hypothetical protein
MAKIFMIMFVLILAIFCLNSPFAFGGDEHPWDEEIGGGGGGGDVDGVNPNPPIYDNPAKMVFSIDSSRALKDACSIISLIKFSLFAYTAF